MKANKDIVLTAMRGLGRSDALNLRQRADAMTGTEIIAEEHSIPQWSPNKDYSEWPMGAPVTYDGQVYKLLQPHNAEHYPDTTPANVPALWGLCHTTDPAKAKPFVTPLGTSGMYYKGECCTEPEYEDPTAVWRLIVDSTDQRPSAWTDGWARVGGDSNE